MKIKIKPRFRDTGNEWKLCDQPLNKQQVNVSDTGTVQVSVGLEIHTSGTFNGKIELELHELYELIGFAKQSMHRKIMTRLTEIENGED